MRLTEQNTCGSPLAFDELLARVANDRELLRELLEIFKADVPKQLASLREAVERADGAKVTVAAHTLKGVLLNLAAKPAAASAATLEKLARESKLNEFADSLKALEEQIQRLMPEIEACLAGVCP